MVIAASAVGTLAPAVYLVPSLSLQLLLSLLNQNDNVNENEKAWPRLCVSLFSMELTQALSFGGGKGGILMNRQINAEFAALTRRTGNGDSSFVILDDAVTDR